MGAFVDALTPHTKLPPTLLSVIPRRLFEFMAANHLDGTLAQLAAPLWREIAYDFDITPAQLVEALTMPGGYLVCSKGRWRLRAWDEIAAPILQARERWRRKQQRDAAELRRDESEEVPGIIRADIREISPNERRGERELLVITGESEREGRAPLAQVLAGAAESLPAQAPSAPTPLPSALPPLTEPAEPGKILTPEEALVAIRGSAAALGWPSKRRAPGVRMKRVLAAMGGVSVPELATAFRMACAYDKDHPGASLVVAIVERQRRDKAEERLQASRPQPRLGVVNAEQDELAGMSVEEREVAKEQALQAIQRLTGVRMQVV